MSLGKRVVWKGLIGTKEKILRNVKELSKTINKKLQTYVMILCQSINIEIKHNLHPKNTQT